MSVEFCPGYASAPFAELVSDYPGTEVYPADAFRTEWGPIFHRGRLDGSARVLVIGQDPAAHETVARRILIGTAGHRAQGLLAKLGITQSYVLMNTFLYCLFRTDSGAEFVSKPALVRYREAWLDAIFQTSPIEAVVALGTLAEKAWKSWASKNPSKASGVVFRKVFHPTYPESAGKQDANKVAVLTAGLLENWNEALDAIRPHLSHSDIAVLSEHYGTAWKASDLKPIPQRDLPAGSPLWMARTDGWASRVGTTGPEKRATIQVRVPASAMGAPLVGMLKAHAVATALGALTASEPRRLALKGTIVTMRSGGVLRDHVLYIEGDRIQDLRPAGQPSPEGFAGITTLDTKALIFPGLIDLHNHLAYDVLPLWKVPKRFQRREQWSGIPEYTAKITKPMQAIGKLANVLPAICRYVECKALAGGATTSQGIMLVNQSGIRKFFKGVLRNVELPDVDALPAASARIADADADDVEKFWKTLQKEKSCYLLHMSEGIDDKARQHFTALQRNDSWAVSGVLAGIHCAALKKADFKVLADRFASMVWSPFSNLLLYGDTANVTAAKEVGLRIALGPDWSPSGSKNMLGELKVARLYSQAHGGVFSDEDLVAMATVQAAGVLKWDGEVGTLEAGKLADLLVVKGAATTPYKALIEARESDIKLVVVGGTPRYGEASLMAQLVPEPEAVHVAGMKQAFYMKKALVEVETSPELPETSFASAQKLLADALLNVPSLVGVPDTLKTALQGTHGPEWELALDEIEDHGVEMRSKMGLVGRAASVGPTRGVALKSAPKPKIEPVVLDALTVVEDGGFMKCVQAQANLPDYVKFGLPKLY